MSSIKKKVPPSYFEEVRKNVEWYLLLSKFGIKTSNKQHPFITSRVGNFITLCPFHIEKSPSMHFFCGSGKFYCFGCNEKGDIFDFISKMFGNNKTKTFHWLRKNFNIPLPWKSSKNRS